jgi:hypothetical protein
MNTAQHTDRAPQLRASDADRDRVVATLSENFQAGRLTSEELDERTGRALAARTMGELAELTADLPAPAAPRQAPPGARQRWRAHPGLVVLVPLLAALSVVSLVLSVGAGRHGWAAWWVVPVALLVARRLAVRRGARQDSTWH